MLWFSKLAKIQELLIRQYLAVGLKQNGKKEVLGMWLGKNKSSVFWVSALTDLKNRGVRDILITVTDKLNMLLHQVKKVFQDMLHY